MQATQPGTASTPSQSNVKDPIRECKNALLLSYFHYVVRVLNAKLVELSNTNLLMAFAQSDLASAPSSTTALLQSLPNNIDQIKEYFLLADEPTAEEMQPFCLIIGTKGHFLMKQGEVEAAKRIEDYLRTRLADEMVNYFFSGKPLPIMTVLHLGEFSHIPTDTKKINPNIILRVT